MDEKRKINIDFYNKNAERWASIKTNSFYHEEGFRKFVRLLKDGDSVVDIGCAYGIHVPLFIGIGRNLKYEGFDISEKMIEIATSHYPQLNFYVADILDPETLPKNKFNGFWAGAVLMHIPKEQWDQMLNNIQSLMVKESFGYFTLPLNRPNDPSETDQRHFSIFEESELSSYLEKHNWKIIEKGEFPSDTRSIWNWYLVKLP